jgi:uncharacterized protein YecE (DUF72 family)
MSPNSPFIGIAGWSIAREAAGAFPMEGSGLERYSAVLPSVEINSSFYRPRRASTWERWRDSVPEKFRFSVKVPKTVTHVAKLVGADEALMAFLGEVALLKDKLGVLLVQLPPSLALDEVLAASFFKDLVTRTPARVAVEPRHASWFTDQADALLMERGVARVGADPARVPRAAVPLVVNGLAYWRLHGSPVMYRSSYADRIDEIAVAIRQTEADQRWCIFDNTASSAATGNALALMKRLGEDTPDTAQSASQGLSGPGKP